MSRVVFLAAILAFAAYAQPKDQVAIINTVDDGNPPIALLEMIHLTDKLREVAVGILPKNRYSVMTTESIVALFESVEEAARACNESTCLVELGRKITADYVAQGRIGRFGGDLTIKVELYHSMSGSLVASFTGNSKNVHGLLSILDAKAPEMFKKMLPVSGGSSGVPSIVGGIGSVETAAGIALEYGRSYLVSLNTEPQGAALSFNGVPVGSCSKAPCKLELPEGDVRILAALEQYETADTTVSIKQNNQSVNIKLVSSFGVLEIKPAYSDGIGNSSRWNLTINGKAYASWGNRLSPGNYEVKLGHECYEDISFKVGIAKGGREVFDMAEYLKLKEGGLVLSAEKNNEPVSEPVFANGKRVGETPFSGSLPVCSKIEVGEDREAVFVKLKYREVVKYRHKMDDYYDLSRRVSVETDLYKVVEERKSPVKTFWAVAANLVGAGLILVGIYQDGQVDESYKDYRSSITQSEYDSRWGKVEDAKTLRNGLYIVGGLVFATGIVLWF
jgi:hypothetical protein